MPKIYFLLPLYLCFTLFARAQDTAKLDQDNGFAGYFLGDGKAHNPPLHMTGKQQKMEVYRPEKDTIIFEGVLLKSLRLRFFQGKIHSLVVKVEGEARSSKLLDYFTKRYGAGQKANSFDSAIHWRGEKVALIYDKNLMTGDAEFQFIEMGIHKEYEIYMYKRANED